jgi:histone-lysine N-methyltransferase SETMAR
MLISSIVLLHGNVHLHTAAHTRALLEHFNWELFDHPPYSPDLARSDYHLFTYLKNWLGITVLQQ